MAEGSLSILLIGSGGREHALARALSKSPLVQAVYVAPGNGGTATGLAKVQNVPIGETEFGELLDFALDNAVNLVVPGPEAPLVDGIEDSCRNAGIRCFGPTQQAAQLEGSKAFSKDFMQRNGIPTASFKTFTDDELAHGYLDAVSHDVVIKASGLAAGKGVIIPETKKEAHDAVDFMMADKKFGQAGEEVVIEEYLVGEELSVLSFCDGYTIRSLPPAQDHKQIFTGDQGPMTGGMGCYSPCKIATSALIQEIHEKCLQPTIDAMRRERMPFRGLLFTGFMITKSGPKVLEYNVRFGDPETQTLLPNLKSDLAEIMLACTDGYLDDIKIAMKPRSFSATVIAAAPGYPGPYPKGLGIQIDDEAVPKDAFVYHAGTARPAEKLVTSGGRVLAVNGTGPSLEAALESAYTAMNLINFKGMHYRTDIAHRDLNRVSTAATAVPAATPAPSLSSPTALKGKKTATSATAAAATATTTATSSLSQDPLTYAGAGVSVEAGNSLVKLIKPLVESTRRSGSDGSIGGFGGVFDLAAAQYAEVPRLVVGTDGVGTKLNIAHAVGKHDSIGIDCVAMNVNDLVVQGAEPLVFVDCYTCGKLDVDVAAKVIAGVAAGCRQAGCVLAGGETAEMPGIFTMGDTARDAGDVYDLVGTAVGAVPHDRRLLPDKEAMRKGDVLLGLASSGVHSNGFSLARKVVERAGLGYNDAAPWVAEGEGGLSVGESLLTPTRIYVKPLLRLVARDLVKGMAHITGGGLVDNVPRMLPAHLAAHIDVSKWDVPPVLRWLKREGSIADAEFATAFNTGLGMVLVVDETKAVSAIMELEAAGEKVREIGVLVDRAEGGQGTILANMEAWNP